MMSTNPNRFRPELRGYTFLELALALAVAAMVFAAMVPVLTASQRENRLRSAAADIASLVQATRLRAEKSGASQALWFQSGGLIEKKGDEKKRESFRLPETSRWFVRLPGGEWQKPSEQIWNFSAIGTLTPFSIRIEEGSAWLESDFDFLTGMVADERYTF